MRGEFVDIDGARLYYFAAGSRGVGEPVVLVHGFPTSSHLWSPLVPLLPQGHRAVVLDLLGYGRSDVPGKRDLSLRGHAERVVALLDALSIDRATVVGHDTGGGVAQMMAVHWPQRVARLCLCNSVGFGLWPSRAAKLARALRPLASQLPAHWVLALLRRHLLRGYSVAERGTHSVDHYLRPFATAEGVGVLLRHLASLDCAETTAAGPKLKEIGVPTAVVWGSEDPFLPRRIAETLRASIPSATLDYIANVRHFVPEEAPERLAQVIARLLRR